MAYAALVSLAQTLEHILLSPIPLEKPKLVSLQQNVANMLTFLEDFSNKCNDAINVLENRIIDVAYEAEDLAESYFSSLYLSQTRFQTTSKHRKKHKSKNYSSPESSSAVSEVGYEELQEINASKNSTSSSALEKVLQEIDFILEEMMNIKKNFVVRNQASSSFDAENLVVGFNDIDYINDLPNPSGEKAMMGFDDEFMGIKEQLYQNSSKLKIVPIVGMGGIGKTTLARRLYDDASNMEHFDTRVWIVVSREYSIRKILLVVLRSINMLTDELYLVCDDELIGMVYKELIKRRYLVVVDDMWSTNSWDDLKVMFPENNAGSRVLVTTRLNDVATYVGSSSSLVHEMHLLSVKQSWSLLEERVFEQGTCPSQLEKIGKKIAKNCRGLPLTLVVVGGLLKENITKEHWAVVSQNINCTEPTIALHCSNVLALSYDSLPLHLKPCCLYVTAFPEDYEIHVNQLVRLWIAEGFVRFSGSNCVEEVAEEYLEDLVRRSLLIVTKKYNGKIKTVRIHDLLRDIGTFKAREGRFHSHSLLRNVDGKQRRISILAHDPLYSLPSIDESMTRSLLIFSSQNFLSPCPIPNFRLLRILHAPTLPLTLIPEKMIHLRYLAFRYEGRKLPSSISGLWNIQTLVINDGTSSRMPNGIREIVYRRISLPRADGVLFLPLEIWTMPSLRHLILLKEGYLEKPSSSTNVRETNLQTLTLVNDLRLTEHVVKMLVNLRKLGLSYSGIGRGGWRKIKLSNLVRLPKLEILKIIFRRDVNQKTADHKVKFLFPSSLRKLTLLNCEIPWLYMSAVGQLPNLEVLKLNSGAFVRRNWNPIEGEFLRLKYLQFSIIDLDQWGADSVHFPCLERLVLMNNGKSLKELPSAIEDMNTLRLVTSLWPIN